MQLKWSLDFENEFAEFEESSQSQGKIDSMSGNNYTPSEDKIFEISGFLGYKLNEFIISHRIGAFFYH